jgi:iron complex transport system permease protein
MSVAGRLGSAVLVLVVLLVAVGWGALCVGTYLVPPGQVVRILRDPSLADPADHAWLAQEARIVRDIRLPRVLLAALVGASLALAGAAFQGMLRNSLADPYIVGTSSGAALGAAIAIVLGLSSSIDAAWPARPLFAFVGALLTMAFVFALSRLDGRLPVDTFLLAGVVVGSFLWAFVSFLMAASQGRMREIVFWLMGDLSLASWPLVQMILPYFLAGLAALFLLAHRLNLLAVGEESAAALGVDVERTKILVVVFASLLTAAAVSVSGLIGFLGLMVPHLIRSIWGPDHRILLPASALGGATFLVLADTAARMMGPVEMPVGVLTALFGGPFFFVILRRRLTV